MSGGAPPPPPSPEEVKIKVLIVDDIPETRENLRKLLFFESDIEVVGAATNGHEGVQLAQELQPDVVLMDINMPGMDGITASETITRHSPYTQIIIMSVQGEADYLRRSMLAGAREFLIKPFSGNELITSVRRVYKLGAEQRERLVYTAAAHTGGTGTLPPIEAEEAGKVIAVFSPKGGVGTSTLAINLGIALHKLSSADVAVVDASLQFGDIAVLLNQRARTSIADIASYAEEELTTELIESVLVTHSSGVKALLAPPRPEMADLITPASIVAILKQMRKMFDVVLIDMYSSLQDVVISALDESDLILLITTPEIPAIKSARLFFEVTDALEYPSSKTHLLLNKVDRRGGIRAEDIEAGIKQKIQGQFPLDEKIMTNAVNRGVPYIMSGGNSDLTKATIHYAKKLHKTVLQTESAS